MRYRKPAIAALLLGTSLLVSACQESGGIGGFFPKADRPISPEIAKKMKTKGMASTAPILARIYKEESQLEIWKETGSGRYDLLETFEICKWSGKLGPKIQEGDRQAPEGFYTVNPYQMNPNSDYYLSFNMGFPNAYDRALGRTGTHLMVHGACSSAGCYSMTDEQIADIYALAREAFKGGQKNFQIQAFPFRMTPENMARHRENPNIEFWQMLKEGSDHFEITRVPPKVNVCDKRYVFNRIAEDEKDFRAEKPCPETTTPDTLTLAYSEKQTKDEKAYEEAIRKLAFKELVRTNLKAAQGIGEPVGPETALAVMQGQEALDDGVATHKPGEIPVPLRAPRAVAEPQPEPKKRGFFAWLTRAKS
jgi:murein L,D-transpeptidase YafK